MTDMPDISKYSDSSSSSSDEEDDKEDTSCGHTRGIWAVLYVYALDVHANCRSSLQLLVEVMRERRWASPRSGCNAVEATQKALVQRLLPLPLPVLMRCLRQLQEGRAYWQSHVWQPCARQLAAARAQVARERDNALRYHICLWQRRHPLTLLCDVLQLHHANALCTQKPPPVYIDELLEALTAHLYPDLAHIPWLIRCDVLLTYPHMPLQEQLALMHSLAQCSSSSTHIQEGDSATLKEPSAAAVTPQEMLHGYLPPERIPSRGVDMLSDEAYAAVRAALERHKRDGVIRLSRAAYRRP